MRYEVKFGLHFSSLCIFLYLEGKKMFHLSARLPLMSMSTAKLVRWEQEQVVKETECSSNLLKDKKH